MSTRWARFARGWLAAVFSTLVAAGSHTVAGGAAPSGISIVIALAFAGVTCIVLAGATLSLVKLAASVILSQAAFHTLFGTIGAAAGVRMAGSGAHEHGANLVLVAGGAGPAHHTDGWMWLGHAVAAAATIVALRYGESAFWRLREIALLFVRTVFAAVPDIAPVPLAPVRRSPRGEIRSPLATTFIRLSLGLRGPPVALGA